MFSMSRAVTFGRPCTDGITSSSAPSERISRKRSSVKQSAITISARYPFARHTSASAGPVLPPVYSTTVSPAESSPSRSAPSIIASAMRSFIEPLGFRYSSFTQSSAPFDGTHDSRRTSGVLPIASRMLTRSILPRLAARHEDFFRDHQPLDLRRALVDLEELRVAHQLLHRVLLDVSVAAVDLHGVGRHLHHRVGGEALRERRLQRRALALVDQPRCLPHE